MRAEVTFIPSRVHQGHYIHINGETTGVVINYYCYSTDPEYRKKVNNKINKLTAEYLKSKTT